MKAGLHVVVFGALGLTLLVFGGFLTGRKIIFAAKTEAAHGLVVGLDSAGARGLSRPRVAFKTPDGRSIEFMGLGSKPPSFSVDEAVTVLYPKDHPEKAAIASFSQMWLSNAILLFMGAIFLLASWKFRAQSLSDDWKAPPAEPGLRTSGATVEAEIDESRMSPKEGGTLTSQIAATWVNPDDGKTYRFYSEPSPWSRSEKELDDYTDAVLGGKVSVRIDRFDPQRKYWVNTSSIVPKETEEAWQVPPDEPGLRTSGALVEAEIDESKIICSKGDGTLKSQIAASWVNPDDGKTYRFYSEPSPWSRSEKELEDYTDDVIGGKVSVRIDPRDPKKKYWVNTSSIVPDASD